MKVAVLYQDHKPPAVDGSRKPMKPGGYRDRGADIAYCLWTHGVDAATPVSNSDLYTDLDRVFQIPYRTFVRRLQQARQSGRCTP